MRLERETLQDVMSRARACRVCEAQLSDGVRPVLVASATARLVIIGQAPGSKVHRSGVPWDDDSGRRLRDWMHIGDADFYDPAKVAILPMGFCYPGKGRSGDLPPRPECAPLWHQAILQHLPRDRLLVLAGQYAQKAYLGKRRSKTLTATVQAFRDHLPRAFTLPHPSWRSQMFVKRNPWFEAEVLPELRRQVALRLNEPGGDDIP